MAFVRNRQLDLTMNFQPALFEFPNQRLFVHRFQQAGPAERPMRSIAASTICRLISFSVMLVLPSLTQRRKDAETQRRTAQ